MKLAVAMGGMNPGLLEDLADGLTNATNPSRKGRKKRRF
jgi:hypothetical protein